jgi:hypothetical protein
MFSYFNLQLQSVDTIFYILHNLIVSSFKGASDRLELIGQMLIQKSMVIHLHWLSEKGWAGSL